MESIKNIIKIPEKKKTPKYQFQEICLEIIELAGFDKEQSKIVWILWKRRGWEIRRVLSEMKAGEVTNPEIYIKYLLSNKQT